MFPEAPSDPTARKVFLDHTKERAVLWLDQGGIVQNLNALAESEGLEINDTLFAKVLRAFQIKHEKLLVTHKCVSEAQVELWCQRAPEAKDFHHDVAEGSDMVTLSQKLVSCGLEEELDKCRSLGNGA